MIALFKLINFWEMDVIKLIKSNGDKILKELKTISEVEKLGKKVDEKHYIKTSERLDYQLFKTKLEIEVHCNSIATKENYINLEEFCELTDEELNEVLEDGKKFNSEVRGYITEQILTYEKLVKLLKEKHENGEYADDVKTRNAYKARLALYHGKKGAIASFKLAREAYYEGMDKLEKEVERANKEYYRKMKTKPTSTLLDYYNNRELDDRQFYIIEEILAERGAI